MTNEEAEKLFKVGVHEASKSTLKRLGKSERMLKSVIWLLEETFDETCRRCIHRITRPDSPAYFCDKRGDTTDPCLYKTCPYIRGEAI